MLKPARLIESPSGQTRRSTRPRLLRAWVGHRLISRSSRSGNPAAQEADSKITVGGRGVRQSRGASRTRERDPSTVSSGRSKDETAEDDRRHLSSSSSCRALPPPSGVLVRPDESVDGETAARSYDHQRKDRRSGSDRDPAEQSMDGRPPGVEVYLKVLDRPFSRPPPPEPRPAAVPSIAAQVELR